MILLSVVVGSLLFTHALRRPNISDTIGYTYAAEQLAAGNGLTYSDPNNEIAGEHFMLYAFRIAQDDNPVDKHLGFPPGLPLLLASAITITGRSGAVHFVVPLFALLALWVVYGLGSFLTDNRWVGFWSSVLLVSTPLYWRFGTDAWSELPSIVWVAGGVWAFLIAQRRQRGVWYVAAGMLLAYSVWIRYTNVIILLPLGIYDLLSSKEPIWKARRRWGFYAVAIGNLCGILLFNYLYYGGVTLTSYSPENGWYTQSAFSWRYAFGESFVGGYSAVEIGRTIIQSFHLFLLLIPVGLWSLKRQYAWLLAGCILIFCGLYAVYAFAAADINQRFMLIVFPFVAILCATGLVALGARVPYRWALAAPLLLLLLYPLPGYLSELRERNRGADATYDMILDWLEPIEPNAVVMSYQLNDQIAVFGERSVLNYRHILPYDSAENRYRNDLLEPCLLASVNALQSRDIPVYFIEDRVPSLMGTLELLQDHYSAERVRENPNIYRISGTTPPVTQPCRP